MWRRIFWFELTYWLRGTMLWVFLAIISLMIFGAVSSENIRVGGALQNTYRNAPFVIQNYYAIISLLTLLMTTAFVNSAAARDFACNTHQIIFTTPVNKWQLLTGRFLGSSAVSVIPMLGVSVGVIAGMWMPWIDPERWGPVNGMAHLYGVLLFAIPNTLFIGAILFSIAALTRSTITSFIGALVLLTAYGVSQGMMSDLKNETMAILLDPFGARAFSLLTKYWTVSERNAHPLGFAPLLVINRLIWMSVGAIVYISSCWQFSTAERSGRVVKPPAEPEADAAPAAVPAASAQAGKHVEWAQFLSGCKVEFGGLVKSTSFIVIVAAAMLNTIPTLALNAGEMFGNSAFPVTYNVLQMIKGSLYLFLISMISYYAGVLVWKERDAHMDEILDALPNKAWPLYASKLFALLGAVFLIQCAAIASGVAVQTWQHYYRFQMGLYSTELLGLDFLFFVFLAVLAFFIHVLSPNKYAGYFAYVAFMIFNLFGWKAMGVETNMVVFGSTPNITYSDMYGYAPYMLGWSWFAAYWSAFCVVIAMKTVSFWPRGRETSLVRRTVRAAHDFTGWNRVISIAARVIFVAVGVWIYYNTKVLNKFYSEDETQKRTSEYEKTYKKYQSLPQPRITSVKYEIDLYPETRNAEMRGDQVIVNNSQQPIAQIHIVHDRQFNMVVDLEGASLTTDDKDHGYRIYSLAKPMQPGESRPMRFRVQSQTKGFENELSERQMMPNGTFFNNMIAPQIGYQPQGELNDRNARKKYGLPEKDGMPELERNCTGHCRDTYLSNNSDWVDVETIISTVPDQIAIAPGSLLREWSKDNRRYFQYKLDHASMNFYSFLSARYEVAREEFNGIKSEVYYHSEHKWNVEKMQRSIRKSFDYYTKNFGPYYHKQARIIEFPRVARFAQAFPGTMPYSEAIGFIANLEKPDDIDHVFYVVAHEMGHQWWAHQVIGANMQGATLLSETMAQYSALMVMEKEYGRDTMRKFLKYEMDRYLRSRGTERLKERPLLRVDGGQGYIHYNKGSVAMYYLKEMIGEEAINRALRKIIGQYAYAPSPYPTSYALVDALRAETPAELQYLLKDLFEEITLFSNRALSAKAVKRTDGKYDVTVEVESKKFKADAKGNETEVPVNDWIEVGALAKPEDGKRFGKVLYRKRMLMKSGAGTYTFVTDELPERAGIDPLALLIDRVPDDNLKKLD